MSPRFLAAFAAAVALVPAAAISQPGGASRYDDAQDSATNAAPSDTQTYESDELPAKPKHRLLTPDQEGHQGVVKGVVEAPLRDLNVVHSHIPPVLRRAMEDPYERPDPDDCQEIRTQVRILYDALGPDYDQPPGKHGTFLKNGALDAMREGEKAYIPFDGAIRFVSGASRHDRYVLAAIQAGAARRAYLKGLGEARGCGSPGAPRHFAEARPYVRKEPGF